MTKNETCPQPEQYGDVTVPAFGYELFRNQLIPELLGKETASILYWAGRKLARQYPLESEEKIVAFFEQAGWGSLELTEKGKSQMVFECHSVLIESRIKDHPGSVQFTMEAGFIAEQIQKIHGFVAEAYTEVRTGRNKKAVFIVKWDAKDAARD
ncbi:DUF2507 domain-containing protein [Sporolactobacillus shoreae]|uniref:DUF2507 domain-containing protein n=1 Tax=Sporolactobacillus shoreae TaxID=1465501 RepID=A0A4Z0GQA2_9BACL|nr:YslB family protein [Sporolactobacillus shoreae]TGA99413.1 DUF2507 domain-containing protein [Sporolactobacillus shoreae]